MPISSVASAKTGFHSVTSPFFSPLQSDGLRPVEHAQQGTPAPILQVPRQSAHQRFHRLVRNQTDADMARVLQPRGKEMNALQRAIEELHLHLPKIMLTEFHRQTFKANQRLAHLRTPRSDQFVQRGLSSRLARRPATRPP